MGTVASARAWLDVMEKGGLLGAAVGLRRRPAEGEPFFAPPRRWPAETDVSRKLSKDLAARGFKFCGPTIVVCLHAGGGQVNDHSGAMHRTRCANSADADRTWAAKNGRHGAPPSGRTTRRALAAHAVGPRLDLLDPSRSTSRSRTSRMDWRGSALERAEPGRPHLFGVAQHALLVDIMRASACRSSTPEGSLASCMTRRKSSAT